MKRIAVLLSVIAFTLLVFVPSSGLRAQSSHFITVSWTAPTSGGLPTTYNIKRGTTSGLETLLTTLPATSLSYNDNNGVAGIKYFYVITASNSGGESAPSNEVSATFLADAPGIPGAATATAH